MGQATAAQARGCSPLTPAVVAPCSVVPSADVEATSLALMARYRINDNMSVLRWIKPIQRVQTANVTTLSGYYVVSGDEMAPVAGAAYENKEIALRVELLVQVEIDMALTAASSIAAGSKFQQLQYLGLQWSSLKP